MTTYSRPTDSRLAVIAKKSFGKLRRCTGNCLPVTLFRQPDSTPKLSKPVARKSTSAVFGSVFQLSINSWVVKRRGPLFVVMFHPLGIVFAMAASLFMGETIHVGSLVGSAIIVPGFYSVIWGKAKEWEKKKKSFGSNNNKMSLLQDKTNGHEVNL